MIERDSRDPQDRSRTHPGSPRQPLSAPIGIFGGTFDPVHFGHLRMAQELGEALGLAQVRFIPAATPPHRRPPHASAHHRAAMVQLAIAGNPVFTLDTRELDRSGPSYTVDTLAELRTEYPDAPFCLLLGGDAFLGLAGWHRWQELLSLAHLVVAHRPGASPAEALMSPPLQDLYRQHRTDSINEIRQARAGSILLLPMTALDISASAIRDMLAHGDSPRYLLPDAVQDYIHHHHLYSKETNGT